MRYTFFHYRFLGEMGFTVRYEGPQGRSTRQEASEIALSTFSLAGAQGSSASRKFGERAGARFVELSTVLYCMAWCGPPY